MDAHRVKSKRTGRTGWKYRFTDPVTHSRTHRTIWMGERREADKGITEYLVGREKLSIGLPDNKGWTTSYLDLVAQFLTGSVISTEDRRQDLERLLRLNHLNLKVGADLANIGKLTNACRQLVSAKTVTGHFAAFSIQSPLKQLTRWAATIGLLPYDPLAAWKQLPWGTHKKRKPFDVDEMRAVLLAARDYDKFFRHKHPSDIVFKTLLLTGNRPRAVTSALVADLGEDRITLPPGNGKKRNGAATLPAEFITQLRAYIDKRPAGARLLVSHEGEEIHRINLGKYFRRCMTLAFTRMEWPVEETTIDPMEVAHLFYMGKHKGFDGAPPRNTKKLAARAAHLEAVDAIAGKIGPAVQRRLLQRDMYALRATHVSWGRRLTNPDSVKLQVGHAPRDTEERHYLGMVDASLSSRAVWDLFTGKRTFAPVDPIVALNSKTHPEMKTTTASTSLQVFTAVSFKGKAGERICSVYTTRTRVADHVESEACRVRIPGELDAVLSRPRRAQVLAPKRLAHNWHCGRYDPPHQRLFKLRGSPSLIGTTADGLRGSPERRHHHPKTDGVAAVVRIEPIADS